MFIKIVPILQLFPCSYFPPPMFGDFLGDMIHTLPPPIQWFIDCQLWSISPPAVLWPHLLFCRPHLHHTLMSCNAANVIKYFLQFKQYSIKTSMIPCTRRLHIAVLLSHRHRSRVLGVPCWPQHVNSALVDNQWSFREIFFEIMVNRCIITNGYTTSKSRYLPF